MACRLILSRSQHPYSARLASPRPVRHHRAAPSTRSTRLPCSPALIAKWSATVERKNGWIVSTRLLFPDASRHPDGRRFAVRHRDLLRSTGFELGFPVLRSGASFCRNCKRAFIRAGDAVRPWREVRGDNLSRAPPIAGAVQGCAGADCVGFPCGQSLERSGGARSVMRRQCINIGRR